MIAEVQVAPGADSSKHTSIFTVKNYDRTPVETVQRHLTYIYTILYCHYVICLYDAARV